MPDDLIDIDLAMNLIKEDIIRELSLSVARQNNETYLKDVSSSTFPFSERGTD